MLHLNRLTLSPTALLVSTTALLLLLHNGIFWQQLHDRLNLLSWSGGGYLAAFTMLLLILTLLPLLLLGHRWVLKPLLALFVLLSVLISYFANRFGVIFDVEMIRNIRDNLFEANRAEAMELLSVDLLLYLLFYGLPLWLWIGWVAVRWPEKWWQDLLHRLLWLTGLIGLTLLLLLLNYKMITLFSRENRDLRVYLNPIYALLSTAQLYRQQAIMAMPFETITGSIQNKSSTDPTIGLLVIGETARGDHIALNGYPRPTAPKLSQRTNLLNFPQAASCGTATAYSLPCIFSLLGQSDYSPEKAEHQSNLLDLLQDAGVNVYWFDNNSGCKGICNRLPEGHYRDLSSEQERYDTVLLDELAKLLPQLKSDTLIVLHLLGSHGPAYYKRYPSEFAQFQPNCQHNRPHECPRQELINSYDNTLLFTDHIVDSVITQLEQLPPTLERWMLYASDHGESLGENGVYLHGLPYAIAPSAQTHIPFMLWLSDRLMTARQLSGEQAEPLTQQPISHDQIAHTVLGAFEVQTPPYQAKLDLLHGLTLKP